MNMNIYLLNQRLSIHFEFISWKISKGANYHKTQPLLDLWSRVSVSTTYSTNTIWWVIFGGANFRQKSKVAVRINFRDWMEAQWRCAHMCTRGTKYASQCAYGVHTPLAMCMLLTIELAAIPTRFAELLHKLWGGFLSTLVCEAIMSTMIYGRLVSVRSCRVNTRTDMLLIHMICWYDRERHQLVNSSDEETSAQFLSILVSLYLAPLTWLLYDRVSRSAGASVMRSTTPTARDCACAWHVSLIFLWVVIFMIAKSTTKITKISTPRKLPAIQYYQHTDRWVSHSTWLQHLTARGRRLLGHESIPIVTLDHDFIKAKITPSVSLVIDIPSSPIKGLGNFSGACAF